jgi:hypothetical protein
LIETGDFGSESFLVGAGDDGSKLGTFPGSGENDAGDAAGESFGESGLIKT